VHASPNARIHDTALLIGPVVVGDGCEIRAGARVIGPVVLCEGSRVEEGALLRDSIVWPRSSIGRDARVEYALLTEGCRVAAGERVTGALVDAGRVLADRLNEVAHPGLPVFAADMHGRPENTGRRRLRRAGYLTAKRAMDVALSLAAAPVLLPLVVLIGLAIKLDSAGPVFYRQRRCGKDGREFDVWKFRTMVRLAEQLQARLVANSETGGPMFKMQGDPRITRVGRVLRRTSLDELPQLWCVVMGHMTLVGPRPLAMKEMELSPRWRDIRLKVKPGLTGLWQVNGRSALGFDGWVENDIRYVRDRSLSLDLRILLRTSAL